MCMECLGIIYLIHLSPIPLDLKWVCEGSLWLWLNWERCIRDVLALWVHISTRNNGMSTLFSVFCLLQIVSTVTGGSQSQVCIPITSFFRKKQNNSPTVHVEQRYRCEHIPIKSYETTFSVSLINNENRELRTLRCWGVSFLFQWQDNVNYQFLSYNPAFWHEFEFAVEICEKFLLRQREMLMLLFALTIFYSDRIHQTCCRLKYHQWRR